MTNIPIQFFLKLFFVWPAQTPNWSKTPSVIYHWKAYIIYEKMYISEFLSVVVGGWEIAPEKKILTKKFTKNKHVYTPKTLPFGHEMKKNIFFHDSHSIVSRKLVLYVQIDPRGQIWHFEKKYIYWKLATIKK